MKNNPLRPLIILLLFAFFLNPLGGIIPSQAADANDFNQQIKTGMRVIRPLFVGQSQALRSLEPKPVERSAQQRAESIAQPLRRLPKSLNPSTSRGSETSLLQTQSLGAGMPAPLANFAGVGNINGVLPPDTQGDIGYDPETGKKYYIQWVNLSFQIWDVTNPALPLSVYGPAAGNTLWSGSGTICETNNDGDPITLFDHLSNRWMMSQFALGFPDNFHQCIAVSATADPTGVWYLYDFQTSTTVMNDYPKFGVWPDGYYMTVNQFDGANLGWAGAGVAVFERSAMLQGLPARMIYIDIGAVTLNYGGMLPSDLDGLPPPSGTPNYFMEWDDSSWLGDSADTLRIWEFHVNWNNPANTTFGANSSYDPNQMISTSDEDPDMCGGARNCIPQPGTTARLDAIADRLMYRLQYRDFGSYQTLLTNHTVDASGSDRAGIHWFELRDSGAGWTMRQQGVYSPDTDNRWMGSIAMDDAGNLALGYSVASSSTYPSIRYTGRLSTDPLNLLPQGETTLIAGSGSQLSTSYRWGDYSMMSVDPQDGCTFWYTQEYYATTSSSGWQTRIGAFKFPSCTSLPTGTLQGTVTDASLNPLADVSIDISGGYHTISDANGDYTILLPVGTYDVTASKYGYFPSTANGVTVIASSTTTQDFTLTPAPTHTISGVVTDATTGWPLYARLEISGFPDSPIFTNPATGAYSVDLTAGDYTFTVSAMSGGYQNTVLPLTVIASGTQDFALSPDLVACTAPGYVQTAGFEEDFESWPLSGWTISDGIPGGSGLDWNSSTAYGDSNYTGGAGLAADVNSDKNISTPYDTRLITPLINPASLPSNLLVYKANFQVYSGNEALDLDIKNSGDLSWTNILHWTDNHGAQYSLPGETVAVDLTPYITGQFQLRWRYYTSESFPWDWYAQIDEVKVGADCNPIASAGLVVGAVYDNNTSSAIDNISVEDGGGKSATIINATADSATPNYMYLIGEPAGSVSLTASSYRYTSDVQTPTVVAGSVVTQDFHLDTSLITTTPTSLVFTLPAASPSASLPLTLTNTGGVAAAFEVFSLPGVWGGYAPTGPFADNTRHTGPKNLNDLDASKMRVPLDPGPVSPLAAGNVINSWNTGLAYAWGIGFNTDATDLWLGNIAAGGGDNLNYRFLTSGSNTGDTIDIKPWVSIFAADMAYNPFSGNLWQVNVGGDNCIYEIDPVLMISTGRRVCPAFGTSQRGLAFDPLTYTFYAGSWNDGVINHFAPTGALLDSVSVNLEISGLAFNPATAHLFVLTNHDLGSGLYDVYVLDTLNNYAILGAFDIKQGTSKVFDANTQAGLEIDCSGNLWAVNQSIQKVYVAESGETGVCNWGLPWLTATPSSGSLPSSANSLLSVEVDLTGYPIAPYNAYLRVVADNPYVDTVVPVSVNFSGILQIFLPLVAR